MTNTKHNLIHSTYYGDDCIFLLEDLTNKITPLSVEEKEAYIRSGGNYAEVISKEDSFDDHIIEIFKELTLTHAYQIADYVGIICNHLYKKYGNDMVFVSLARAGSPVGVLMKRYMLWRYGSDIAHYSISIVRDRGIDENALDDIRNQHPEKELCFIDGWTGRGSITFELKKAVEQYNQSRSAHLNSDLIVLMDPAHLSKIAATKKDICLPNACLNSTICGLVSRTIFLKDKNKESYHGAIFLKEYKDQDYTNWFIQKISKKFHEPKESMIADKVDEKYVPSVYQKLSEDFGVLEKTKVNYNDFYFISDLNRTLIYSKRAIQESDPEYCKNLIPIEYKDGRVISYMNKNAYDKLQKLIQYEEFKFLPCTMRTLQQTQRISFIKDVKYYFTDGGINLYKKGNLCTSYGERLLSIFHHYSYDNGYSWAKEIEEVYFELTQKLGISDLEINRHFILPDTTLETLAFFDLRCPEILLTNDTKNMTKEDMITLETVVDILENYHINGCISGRKFYVFPDFLQKNCIFAFTGGLLYGVVAGDSIFDTPLLSMGNEKGLIPIAPKHGKISGNLPITERSGPAAADDILTFVEQKFYM